ncbi:hypothetical protein DOY81_012423, partial [Sarcophaga bullata]
INRISKTFNDFITKGVFALEATEFRNFGITKEVRQASQYEPTKIYHIHNNCITNGLCFICHHAEYGTL